MKNTKFNETKATHIEKLEQFTPIVERVHGEHHPEFFDVRKLFDQLNEKLQANNNADLTEEFSKLREVTNHYEVPNDVCETYEAVYNMLEDLDQAYQAE